MSAAAALPGRLSSARLRSAHYRLAGRVWHRRGRKCSRSGCSTWPTPGRMAPSRSRCVCRVSQARSPLDSSQCAVGWRFLNLQWFRCRPIAAHRWQHAAPQRRAPQLSCAVTSLSASVQAAASHSAAVLPVRHSDCLPASASELTAFAACTAGADCAHQGASARRHPPRELLLHGGTSSLYSRTLASAHEGRRVGRITESCYASALGGVAHSAHCTDQMCYSGAHTRPA